MRTFRTLLATVLLSVTALTAQAQAMSYYAMRDNARYLTDRMAYTLGLADYLLDDLYCINYDYICGVNEYLDDVALGYRYDDYMAIIAARDLALQRLLSARQWRLLMGYDYFYRPISFLNHRWYFGIYRHEPYRPHFYFRAPRHFADYRGGHFFGGMDPRGGHAPGHGGGYRFDRGPQGQPGGGMNHGDMNRGGAGQNRGTVGNRGGQDMNRGGQDMNRGGQEMNRGGQEMNRNGQETRTVNVSNRTMGENRGTVGTTRSGAVSNQGRTGAYGTNRTSSVGTRTSALGRGTSGSTRSSSTRVTAAPSRSSSVGTRTSSMSRSGGSAVRSSSNSGSRGASMGRSNGGGASRSGGAGSRGAGRR